MKLGDLIGKSNDDNKEGKRSYYAGFVSGPNVCVINELSGEFVEFGKERIYRIKLDVNIGDKNYKFISFTPFFINEQEAMNPVPNNYKINDVILKLIQLKNVAGFLDEIEANTLPEFIANFRSKVQYKLRCYIYIEKRISKSGKEFLVIPPAFNNSVLFGSRIGQIKYVKTKSKSKLIESTDNEQDKSIQTNSQNNDVKSEYENFNSEDDLPF
jgi:hypothetical protein